jgi:hypothetical protein
MTTKTLPEIHDWPYVEIAMANAEFKAMFGKEPSVLWVGLYLWSNLKAASPGSSRFLAYGYIPVYLDWSGILTEREFIFGW